MIVTGTDDRALALLGLALLIERPVATASNAPANTLQELFAQVRGCVAIPDGIAGFQPSVMFNLRRDGRLEGRPNIILAKPPSDPSEQKKFAEQIEAAFDKCVPLAITDNLGNVADRQPLAIMLFPPQTEDRDTVEGAQYPKCLDVRASNHECVRDDLASPWRCSDEPPLHLAGYGFCLASVKETRPVCECCAEPRRSFCRPEPGQREMEKRVKP